MSWVMIARSSRPWPTSPIVPLQDVLGLGSSARMNTPATLGGNWRWRVREEALAPELAARLGELTALYGRALTGARLTRRGTSGHPAPPRRARTAA